MAPELGGCGDGEVTPGWSHGAKLAFAGDPIPSQLCYFPIGTLPGISRWAATALNARQSCSLLGDPALGVLGKEEWKQEEGCGFWLRIQKLC